MRDGEGRASARYCSRRPWIGPVAVTQTHFAWFARGPTGRCDTLRKNSEPGLISCAGKSARILHWCSNEPPSMLCGSCREPARRQSTVVEYFFRKAREAEH